MIINGLLILSASMGPVQAARADLVETARARKNMVTMSADFVQKRSSMLTKKPLESRGKLYYRAKPVTAALHVKTPRKSMLRLTPKQYEVFRPGPNTLEQFTLKSEVWTSLLTKTMSAQVQTLEKHFRIVGSEAKGAPAKARRIFFEPRTKKLAKKIAKLEVVIDTKRYVLERVAFTEKGGDSVSFELSNHRLNKGVAPKMFKVPKNPKTRVIRHEAGK